MHYLMFYLVGNEVKCEHIWDAEGPFDHADAVELTNSIKTITNSSKHHQAIALHSYTPEAFKALTERVLTMALAHSQTALDRQHREG